MDTPKKTLNVFVINAKHLTQRLEQVLKLVQFVANMAKSMGFERINCSTIRTHDRGDVLPRMADYAKRFSYEKKGDAYDNHLENISAEIISNMEKHRNAWQIIAGIQDPDAINLVLEDDALVGQDCVDNLKDLLSLLSTCCHSSSFDMLFLGLTPPKETTVFELVSAHDHDAPMDVLVSKEAYFVNSATARKLAEEWTDNKLTHSLRIQLSKYLKSKAKEIKTMYTNRRVTIDGSKLGLFPTTLHTNNVLVFNGKFMLFLNIYMEIDKCDDEKRDGLFQYAKATYREVEKNRTNQFGYADITHMYGLIMYKMKQYEYAEEMFLEAVKVTVEQQGLVSNNTDLLNNSLNVYQHVQKDVNDIFMRLASKYAVSGAIPLLDDLSKK